MCFQYLLRLTVLCCPYSETGPSKVPEITNRLAAPVEIEQYHQMCARTHITLQATDQEILMLSLHLLQVSLVYVNTLMIQQVLKEREWLGLLTAADLRALSPLKWQHINPYGTFALNMKERLPLELVTAYLGATLPDFRPSLG